MSVPRIILDTNVLVTGLRSRRGASFRLISLLGAARFEIAISVPLLFEYEDVLSREAIGIPPRQARDVLDYLCEVAFIRKSISSGDRFLMILKMIWCWKSPSHRTVR